MNVSYMSTNGVVFTALAPTYNNQVINAQLNNYSIIEIGIKISACSCHYDFPININQLTYVRIYHNMKQVNPRAVMIGTGGNEPRYSEKVKIFFDCESFLTSRIKNCGAYSYEVTVHLDKLIRATRVLVYANTMVTTDCSIK